MKGMIRTTLAGLAVVAVSACQQGTPVSPSVGPLGGPPGVQTGNGGPSGSHYTLNIIGVPREKSADMTGNSGHRIFVSLSGNTRILLTEGDVLVLDANGTDGSASFQLPNPDPDGDGTTVYSVFARALGKPGGSSVTTTCAIDPDDGAEVCSVISLELTRTKGRSRFDNVSKYLLYIYADIAEDGDLERVPLFSDSLQGYFWDYDNSGLKLAQLRFYDCSTTVPDADNPGGGQTSNCF
jgi:hypothetical protein